MNLRGGNISELISSAARATTSVLFDPDPWPPGTQGTLGNVVRNASVPGCGEMELMLGNWSQAGVQKNWAALLILAVIAVTVTGNILVIMAVSLEKKLQNATNYFLMSLAVADMLLGVLVMPVSMVTILYTLPSLPPGISMPIPVLGLRDRSKVFSDGSCVMTDGSFVLAGSFVAFFIPLTIMVVTYFLTISALQNEATLCLDQLVPRPKWSTTLTLGFLPQSSLSSEKLFRRSISREAGGAAGGAAGGGMGPGVAPYGRRTMQSISNEQKASKVLGVVFFLFVVMWCPFFITNVLAVVCDPLKCDPVVMSGLLNVFVWVGYLSSAVNPLVYTLFNKTYRAAFSRYVRCKYQPEKKPLQLILVNTIPPLAYNSTQMPLGDMHSLRNGGHPSGGQEDFSLPSLGKAKSNPHKNQGDKEENISCV
ncbi:5-hydroxytryptamine receptor 2A [Osmerus eperlanus]|uniref:5-hydroxytryptamine receptor 2A n=1 Tax=Osmerus eperlanus TaxID=29151 RepID=UPI002E0FD77A